MWPYPKFPTDLVTFTEEILNGNLIFLYSVSCGFVHIYWRDPKWTTLVFGFCGVIMPSFPTKSYSRAIKSCQMDTKLD